MNKQELVEEIKKHAIYHCGEKECYKEGCTQVVDLKLILEIVNQLDEPQKVKIPQFVADIIKEYKDKGAPIIDIFTEKHSNKEYNTWLVTELNAYDRAARAWLDGYEVEKEKRYLVTLKNGQPLVKSQLGNTLYFNQNITAGNYKASRKELEDAGFGWVFDCPGIEIEEVE